MMEPMPDSGKRNSVIARTKTARITSCIQVWQGS
jgi:hypothetical protein